ncbi:MAG: nitrilase-related carbon-nitrogen hydrolase, partial [Dehalococcoidia bacterium]
MSADLTHHASRITYHERSESRITIGLVQMHCPKGEIDANLDAIEAHIREASTRGVDILCFPEMSITGY